MQCVMVRQMPQTQLFIAQWTDLPDSPRPIRQTWLHQEELGSGLRLTYQDDPCQYCCVIHFSTN